MLVYAVRRVLLTVPLLLAASLLVFAIVSSFPGDACRELAGQHPTPEVLAKCRQDLRLDEPFLARYGHFLGGAVRLDLGNDFRTKQAVVPELLQKLTATIELAMLAMVLAGVVGILVGVRSALRPGSVMDAVGQVLSLGGVSVPVFWLGMMLIALLGVELRWLPFGGYTRTAVAPDVTYVTQAFFTESLLRLEPAAALRALSRLAMPALALSTIPLATITRMTRSAMLEEVGKDYVTTARAKGLPERRVIGRHVLRNALVPIVTITGLQMGALLSGAVLTETVFDWPGLGTHMLRAATQRNDPVVMASMLLFVTIFVLVNLLVDVLYHWIDPRMRQAGAGG